MNIGNFEVEYINPPELKELNIRSSWIGDNPIITARLVNERDVYILVESSSNGNYWYLLLDDRSNIIYQGGYSLYKFSKEDERFSLLSPTQKIIYLLNKSPLLT